MGRSVTSGSRRTTPADNRTTTNPARAVVIGVLALLTLLALLGSVVVAGPRAVSAQSFDGPSGGASLTIVDQTTFVAADGMIDLTIDVVQPESAGDQAEPLVLSVTFYGRLDSEGEVDLPPTEPLNRLAPTPLNRAPRTEAGHVSLSIPVRSAASFDDRDRVLLPEAGVYPLTVELRDDEGPLVSVRTHVVRQPTTTDNERAQTPIDVSVVLPISTAEGLTVAAATELLNQHPSIPLTLLLGPGVVNQLRSQPEVAVALAQALGERQVLTTPTIDLDPSALADIGQGDLYLQAALADREALVTLGLRPAERVAPIAAPLTEAGLTLVDRLGVSAVLDWDNAFPTGGMLESGSVATRLLRADPDLGRILGDTGTVVTRATGPYRANRALARLILRREVDDSPVIIGGPELGVDPAPAIDAFLRSLSQPGAPQPIPLSAVAGGPPIRLAERPLQDLTPVADLVADLQARLATYETFHLTGGTDPDDYRQQIVAALTRQRNPEDRRRALAVLANQLGGELGVITVNEPQPVTLAARSASIPVVVDNAASGPRQVLLRLRGDRVASSADEQLLVIQPGTSSIDIDIEARSFGVSPLEVSIVTPDGNLELAAARFEIRSTALPGLGLLVSLSAVGLLGLWWIVDHRRRRSARDATASTTTTDDGGRPDPDRAPEPTREPVPG